MADRRPLGGGKVDAEMTASRLDRLLAARIYLIATPPDESRRPGTPAANAWIERVATLARSGVKLIQLRQKTGNTSSRRAWLSALRQQLPADALLIVNDDLAALRDADGGPLADGVHIGRDDARVLGSGDLVRGLRLAREQIGSDMLLGSSTRSRTEIRDALDGGVDHVGFGAMAQSPTKSGTTRADPAELLACEAAFPMLPIFPIGGLHLGNLALLSGLRVRRAATGSALLQAEDPEAAVAALLEWSGDARTR